MTIYLGIRINFGSTRNQGRCAQVRRVRLADVRRLRGGGRIFPELPVFIPKNREYLAQLSVRSTRKKIGDTKSFRGGGGHQNG